MRVSTVGPLLRRLVGLAAARPIWTLLLSCLLAAVSVVYALTALTLKTSQRDLLPAGNPTSSATPSTRASSATSTTSPSWWRRPRSPRPRSTPAAWRASCGPGRFPSSASPIGSIPSSSRAARCSICPPSGSAEIRDKIFDSQELMEAFAARPTLDTLVEGISTPGGERIRLRLPRPRPLRVERGRGPALHPGPRQPDLRAARSSHALPLALRRPLLGGRRRRGRAPATSSPRISACSSSWSSRSAGRAASPTTARPSRASAPPSPPSRPTSPASRWG